MTPMFWNNLLAHITFAQQEMKAEDYYYYMLGMQAVFITNNMSQRDTIDKLAKLAEIKMLAMNKEQAT